MNSILISVKKMLGIEPDQTSFDSELIFHINTMLFAITQLGIGPETGFSILSADETWEDFLDTTTNLEAVKSYLYIKVRLLFDPPSSSFVLDAMQRQAAEIEWRLNVQIENDTYVPVVEEVIE